MTAADQARRAELAKYEIAYRDPHYRMSAGRFEQACAALVALPSRGPYLDVSCGRAEMLRAAEQAGYGPCRGTETVADLLGPDVVHALAWALPFEDREFELVTMFDVIEHLLPGDDERAVRELLRVSRRFVVLTANNKASIHEGMDLHVNKRPFKEWDGLFRSWHSGRVTWLQQRFAKGSHMWQLEI